ncbi:uncharacterized protein BCR38DRAFT_443640 [Pseudomassariella vexata]|uniref:Pathway-specific nitrogen regulator n=1 Tax=Pseudomassariella vexata TaxID=1141098 RepID=A0A1Y2DMZ4_9PEZI|nr:uncharacterized protein BCR38DRAFT_443640 [Pseudomassariella vexata]ORY60015.1 hypothetical protein BCR38DRAFT_443640 [Pseudomassariella vexata]
MVRQNKPNYDFNIHVDPSCLSDPMDDETIPHTEEVRKTEGIRESIEVDELTSQPEPTGEEAAEDDAAFDEDTYNHPSVESVAGEGNGEDSMLSNNTDEDAQSRVSDTTPTHDEGGDSSSQHEHDEDVFSENSQSKRSSIGSYDGGSESGKARDNSDKNTTRTPRVSDISQYDREDFVPTARGTPRPPFRTPSDVRALQMSSPAPSVFGGSAIGSPRSSKRTTFPTVSRLGSQSPSAQYSPKNRTPSRFKVKKEAPLVLLHCTLLPLRWMHGDLMNKLDSCELSEEVKTLREAWRMLQDRMGDTVIERGILLGHPQNDYEILEERLLEALELPMRRRARILECGHYLGPANLTTVDDNSESESEDEYNAVRPEAKKHWCNTCKHDIRYDALGEGKIFRVKVYASNGLMKAGAWDACWKEMERVDVELLPVVEPAVQQELARLARKEAQQKPSSPAHDDDEHLTEEEKRMREMYGRTPEPDLSHINTHQPQSSRPYQQASLPQLLLQSVRVLMQDRKNIAILTLSVFVLLMAVRTAPQHLHLQYDPSIFGVKNILQMHQVPVAKAPQAIVQERQQLAAPVVESVDNHYTPAEAVVAQHTPTQGSMAAPEAPIVQKVVNKASVQENVIATPSVMQEEDVPQHTPVHTPVQESVVAKLETVQNVDDPAPAQETVIAEPEMVQEEVARDMPVPECVIVESETVLEEVTQDPVVQESIVPEPEIMQEQVTPDTPVQKCVTSEPATVLKAVTHETPVHKNIVLEPKIVQEEVAQNKPVRKCIIAEPVIEQEEVKQSTRTQECAVAEPSRVPDVDDTPAQESIVAEPAILDEVDDMPAQESAPAQESIDEEPLLVEDVDDMSAQEPVAVDPSVMDSKETDQVLAPDCVIAEFSSVEEVDDAPVQESIIAEPPIEEKEEEEEDHMSSPECSVMEPSTVDYVVPEPTTEQETEAAEFIVEEVEQDLPVQETESAELVVDDVQDCMPAQENIATESIIDDVSEDLPDQDNEAAETIVDDVAEEDLPMPECIFTPGSSAQQEDSAPAQQGNATESIIDILEELFPSHESKAAKSIFNMENHNPAQIDYNPATPSISQEKFQIPSHTSILASMPTAPLPKAMDPCEGRMGAYEAPSVAPAPEPTHETVTDRMTVRVFEVVTETIRATATVTEQDNMPEATAQPATSEAEVSVDPDLSEPVCLLWDLR